MQDPAGFGRARRPLGRQIAAAVAGVVFAGARAFLDFRLRLGDGLAHLGRDQGGQLARAAGKFIALDPKPKHRLAFSGLDLITPNKREALQLAGIEPEPGERFPATDVCARLHDRYGTKYVVVTLGEDGMLLGASGRVLKTIPTAARQIYDVSGAGDTARAALVLALSSGAALEEAAHFANAAAGVVVAKLGTATVSPEELLEHVSRES